MNQFAFEIGQRVELSMSQERGEVIGRAEYRDYPPSYMVRYVTADGRQNEDWFTSSAIESI